MCSPILHSCDFDLGHNFLLEEEKLDTTDAPVKSLPVSSAVPTASSGLDVHTITSTRTLNYRSDCVHVHCLSSPLEANLGSWGWKLGEMGIGTGREGRLELREMGIGTGRDGDGNWERREVGTGRDGDRNWERREVGTERDGDRNWERWGWKLGEKGGWN